MRSLGTWNRFPHCLLALTLSGCPISGGSAGTDSKPTSPTPSTTPVALALSGPTRIAAGFCAYSAYWVKLLASDGSPAVAPVSGVTVALSGAGSGSFHAPANPACGGTAISSVTIQSLGNQAAFFFEDSSAESLTFLASSPGLTSASLDVTTLGSSQSFAFTGGSQPFTVPNGVTSITVSAWGAGGGGGGWPIGIPLTALGFGFGAAGGFVYATLSVIPGETLTVQVGGGGGSPNQYCLVAGLPTNCGPNNSTDGGMGGGGGGASGIYRAATLLAMAGGGGGGGGQGVGSCVNAVKTGRGGTGGDVVGQPNNLAGAALPSGLGGTATVGGGSSFGTGSWTLGTSGSQGQGGKGGSSLGGLPGGAANGGYGGGGPGGISQSASICGNGGGGGGGYYGGGGGAAPSVSDGSTWAGGGGGGSGYLGSALGFFNSFYQSAGSAPNTNLPGYDGTAGWPGGGYPNGNGANGQVVIWW
jgi:hypothetical protein